MTLLSASCTIRYTAVCSPAGSGAAVLSRRSSTRTSELRSRAIKVLDVIDARGGTEIDEGVVGAHDSDGVARFGQSIARELIDLGQGVTRAGGIGAHFSPAGSGLKRDPGKIVADDVVDVPGQADALLGHRSLLVGVTQSLDLLGSGLPAVGVKPPGAHHIAGDQRQQRG